MSRYREYPGPNLDRMFELERYDLERACNILFYDYRSDWGHRSMEWINLIMNQCSSQQRATRATYGRTVRQINS